MILIKHVLVATDFSEPSGAALNYGRELARTFAATLHVLHVADNVTFQYGVEGYSTLLPEMQEDVEASARRQLDALITEEDRVDAACRGRGHHRRAQGRRHRPLRQRAPDGSHRHGDAWPRRGQSPLDGECGRARGADGPLSGADGAPSRAGIRHPRRARRRRASLIMQTLFPPLPAADELNAHRLVLRDGSVAIVRPAGPSDREAMRRFFHELSPESRRHRFFIAGEPPDAVIDRFCAAADPAALVAGSDPESRRSVAYQVRRIPMAFAARECIFSNPITMLTRSVRGTAGWKWMSSTPASGSPGSRDAK